MSTQPSSIDEPESFNGIDRGGIDVFDSLLVRHRICPGQTEAVLELIAEWAVEHRGGDVRAVLPMDGVSLVTLFLDRGSFGWMNEENTSDDALLWYIEVADDDADEWLDPDATIRNVSPLYDTELVTLLDGNAAVHADGRDGHQLITHATNPHRQERYAEHCDSSLVAPAAGDDLPISVVVTTVPLKPGLVSWLVSRVVRIGNWFKRHNRVSEWIRDQTDTLEEEAMYTESLLLEAVGDRLILHYYMEAEDQDRVAKAYQESDNWDVRFSDWAMHRIFVNPDEVLDPPLESDCEVLVHAVHPGRP